MQFDESKHKILIVDDIISNVHVIANFLKDAGYQIDFATSGEKALKLTQNYSFDLILLDVMMPGKDGFEVCSELKINEKTKDIPVIFVTAYDDIDFITKGFECGGVDYIIKPFNYLELLARLKTHLKLKYTEKRLLEINATKDKFFSIIAHDLKNPFSILLQNSKLISDKFNSYSNETLVRMAKRIHNSSELLYNLLENLLEWSRIQTGIMKFQPQPFDMKEIVDNNINLLRTNASKKNIKINNEIATGLIVKFDEEMINTVFRNLISNGIKYCNPNGQITITARINEENTVLAVEDNGVGIDKSEAAKLFNIGNTHSTSGTSGEKGTGLGLILCKEFVEKNNGKIWVRSAKGKGTVFYFTLPLPSNDN